MTTAPLLGRLAAALPSAVHWVGRLRRWVPQPVGWLLADPHRVLTLGWLLGVLIVGGARMAHADTIIVGPDLAQGAPKTLFETYDFITYKLTVKPDDAHSDWFGVSQGVLEVVGFLNNLILWACLGILYGGLVLLEWFLNLTVYRDSAPQIDAATQMIATQVFWPLIAATVAVGAFVAYARWRGEGRGFLSDLGWVVAAGALAVGFAAGPSSVMNSVDGVRQDIASGVIGGSAQYASMANNPTGFATPPIGGEPQKAGTRKLVDGVWNTFGATMWCFTEFHDLDICRVAGYHALADDKQWQQWMDTLDENKDTPPEFREYGDWVRGQDMTRTGYVLLLALITIPMGLMLLRLVVSGLVAVIGFLLMLVIGLVFLAFWPIPGWFRQTGTRYWVYTLGLQLQALFITVVISGVMVISTIIATQAGTYGFFIVALLNLGLFVAALQARSWLEMLTTLGGASSMGFATALMVRSAVRTVVGGAAGLAGAGLGLAGAGLRGVGWAGSALGRGPGWGNQPGATTSRWGTRTGTVPRMAGLDSGGPIQAAAWRVRQPGHDPALPGARPALPSGGSGSGAVVVSGGARRGASGGSAPVGAQGTHRAGAASSRPEVLDGTLASNVAASQAKTGVKGRVWVDQKGSGLSSLDKTPPPRPARQKGGAHQITTLPRRPRRRGQ